MRLLYNKHHGDFPDDSVYIGRGSIWGNPFVIGKDGDRSQVIEKYREYLRTNHRLRKHLPELEGRALVCYCYPHPCHGNVLLEYLEKLG